MVAPELPPPPPPPVQAGTRTTMPPRRPTTRRWLFILRNHSGKETWGNAKRSAVLLPARSCSPPQGDRPAARRNQLPDCQETPIETSLGLRPASLKREARAAGRPGRGQDSCPPYDRHPGLRARRSILHL